MNLRVSEIKCIATEFKMHSWVTLKQSQKELANTEYHAVLCYAMLSYAILYVSVLMISPCTYSTLCV